MPAKRRQPKQQAQLRQQQSKRPKRSKQQGQQAQNSQLQQEINEQLAAYAWLQAIGTNIAAIGQTKLLSSSEKEQDEGQNLIIIGNIIQAIANAVQAELTLQQTPFVTNKRANNWNALGSLLQTVGNSIQALTTDDS